MEYTWSEESNGTAERRTFVTAGEKYPAYLEVEPFDDAIAWTLTGVMEPLAAGIAPSVEEAQAEAATVLARSGGA